MSYKKKEKDLPDFEDVTLILEFKIHCKKCGISFHLRSLFPEPSIDAIVIGVHAALRQLKKPRACPSCKEKIESLGDWEMLRFP